MLNLPIVDPYRVVDLVMAEIARHGRSGPYNELHFTQAAIFASAALTALGAQPAVAGDTAHPHVIEGQDLLDSFEAKGV